MGCYVNPRDQDKEQWLETFGRPVNHTEAAITESEVPVCLVNNGPFFAAGVAFCEREIEEFKRPDDHRPKQWFMVPREKLYEVSDLKSWE